MNNIIKLLIIILIVTSKIFSQELIITVPDQYVISDLPLPPFPKEVIHSLEEISYDKILLKKFALRSIILDQISYIYYPEFLDFKIDDRSIFSHTTEIKSGFEDVKISYLTTYENNRYSISGGIGFNSEENLIDAVINYNEYRLPMDVGIIGSLEDKDLSLVISQKNYFREWSLETGLDEELFFVTADFRDDRLLRPFVSLGFKSSEDYYGSIAFGKDWFRTGISLSDGYIYPYVGLIKDFRLLQLKLDTNICFEYVDYMSSLILKNSGSLEVGFGTEVSEEYTVFDHYLYLSESFLFGSREYIVSTEDINVEFSFIKDSITSIISLNYLYDSEEFYMEILFNYEVGAQ